MGRIGHPASYHEVEDHRVGGSAHFVGAAEVASYPIWCPPVHKQIKWYAATSCIYDAQCTPLRALP